MESFGAIVDAFGIKQLAALLRVDESHVRTMKARNSIPPEYWAAIIANAPDKHRDAITFERLAEIRSRRFRPEKKNARPFAGEGAKVA